MSNRRRIRANADISTVLNQLDGAQIPGGCDTCDAYQTVQSQGHPAIALLAVHHDDWCPTYQRIEAAGADDDE